MASGVDLKVEVVGEKQLLRALRSFGPAAQRRIARPAVRAASTPVLKAARQNAPKKKDPRTGQLRRSLGRRIVTYRRTGNVVAIIGPRTKMVTVDGHGRKVNPTKYAHLLEFGTAPHSYKTRAGLHPGAKARPFMRPAWQANRAAAMGIMRAKLWEGIQKEAAKAAAKARAT